jgi:hypothetical protein
MALLPLQRTWRAPRARAHIRLGVLPWLSRILPPVLVGLSVLVGAYTLFVLLTDPAFVPGFDFRIYHEAAARWLAGGGFYYPHQLAGPYVVGPVEVMYPPVALLLFVPFTILPAALWYAIPLGIIAWRVVALRPSRWGWVAVAALACWPYSVEIAFNGNPTIWIAALLALSTRWPWVSVFVLIKPSLFPFALAGIRTRAWWVALGAFALACALFLPMWLDWVKVVWYARGPFSGPFYSVKDLTWMLIPAVAWLSRRRRRRDPGLRSRLGLCRFSKRSKERAREPFAPVKGRRTAPPQC